ncbi:MAG: class I SAM-dependent methyltransferase [Candidatus Sumerlaeia bacterium]|nr:class I SAM-dependent methyltransferase [Candidatus Sumerlaeia bacterium]
MGLLVAAVRLGILGELVTAMRRRLREWLGQRPETLARDAGRYWSASEASAPIRDLSHWRGQGRWADEEAWLRIGRGHRARFEALRRLAQATGPFCAMAEWGPGGGSNALAHADLFERFHGIDISAANLEECGRQLAATGYGGFRPVAIDPNRPEAAREGVGEPVDFFLSTAVFQHFPGKEYGVRVLGEAFAMLRPGGLALIQTRYDDGTERYRPRRANYGAHAITFTSYAIQEFWRLAEEAGFRPLAVELAPATNYAYYGMER